MSPQTAAMAPSMLIGSGRSVERGMPRQRVLDRAHELRVARDRPRARARSAAAASRADRSCGTDGRIPAAGFRPSATSSLDQHRSRRPPATGPSRASASPSSSSWRQASASPPWCGRIPGRPRRPQPRSDAPGRRGVARGQRRRRRRAVVDERDEHRVHQPADRRRRQLAGEQQIDRLAEVDAAHQLVEPVAAHENAVRLDVREAGRPRARGAGLAARRGLGRAIQPISEVPEAGQDELLRVQLAIDDGRVDRARPDARPRPRRCPRARRRCRPAGCRARRPARAASIAAIALPPVASIGSTTSAVLFDEIARQLRVVARRDRRVLVALQADVTDARVRQQLEHRIHHAEAGAQHRHDDDVGVERLALAPVSSGVSTRRQRHRQLARRLDREHQAQPMRQPPEMARPSSSCRAARSARPARSDAARDGRARGDYTRKRSRICAGCAALDSAARASARGCWRVVGRAASSRSRPAGHAASSARHRAAPSSRWTRTARVIPDGAVAIDGDRDRRGRHRRRARRAATQPARAHRRPRPGHPARPHQHAHARADGAVPRPGRRSGADGLAARSYIFPAEARHRLAGLRARRHAARRARDDRVGHDDVRRHVLLRGRHRRGRRTKRACAPCSASR